MPWSRMLRKSHCNLLIGSPLQLSPLVAWPWLWAPAPPCCCPHAQPHHEPHANMMQMTPRRAPAGLCVGRVHFPLRAPRGITAPLVLCATKPAARVASGLLHLTPQLWGLDGRAMSGKCQQVRRQLRSLVPFGGPCCSLWSGARTKRAVIRAANSGDSSGPRARYPCARARHLGGPPGPAYGHENHAPAG